MEVLDAELICLKGLKWKRLKLIIKKRAMIKVARRFARPSLVILISNSQPRRAVVMIAANQ